MESFRASGADGATVFAICEHDDPESIAAWDAAGAMVLTDHPHRTFAEKINYGYGVTTEDWIFMVGDDVWFHPGWLEAAWRAPLSPRVIGTRGTEDDDPNGKAEHLLIERDYIDRLGASWDGPGVVLHEYHHYYCDTEVLSVARRRGVFAFASDSYVEHLHPNKGKAQIDATYRRGWEHAKEDWTEWLDRRAANMKVAVYGLALNEAVNVEAWADSVSDAHYILLADTGSTDNTVQIAKDCGVEVIELGISPFRFDMAQNAAIAALPREIDWCISLDLDERLQPGWLDALLTAPDDATRVGMWFHWEKELDQMPEGDHWHRDVHRRTGYYWRGPVHEELVTYGFQPEKVVDIKQFQVNHVPDREKPRSGKYLDMIKMALLENPKAVRYSQWLVWQLDQDGRHEEAAEELKRYISEVITFPPDIAFAMLKLSQQEPDRELYWLEQAEKTLPHHRQYKARLAFYFYTAQDWINTLRWADATLSITKPPRDTYDQGFEWTATIHELRSLALFNMGHTPEALDAAEKALASNPGDQRIAGNIAAMKALLQEANH